jgi:tRNA(His) 5'-end guanylyltransferase
MLIILMHNKREYLDAFARLAKRKGVKDGVIIEGKEVGMQLSGMQANIILHRGNVVKAYDKAFVGRICAGNAAEIVDLIESDPALIYLNSEEEGFICTVPFDDIESLVQIPKEG